MFQQLKTLHKGCMLYEYLYLFTFNNQRMCPNVAAIYLYIEMCLSYLICKNKFYINLLKIKEMGKQKGILILKVNT